MEPTISNLFFGLSNNKLNLVLETREIIISSSKEIKEMIKWGRLTFVYEDEPVAFICSCPGKDYIELGFFNGILLVDPKKLLDGKGRSIRRLKITSLKNIPVAQISTWIKQSSAVKV